MNKGFYTRLAWENIIKNKRTYISYIITCILTISMFYIISALVTSPDLDTFFGGGEIKVFLVYGQWVIGFFALIFLFYTHSFLIKRRKKEFGLYNILGMEKKHISKILFFETLYASVISFAFGFMIDILFYKAAQLLLCQITGASVIGGFYISLETVKNTLILFGIIFILTYLNTLRQIHLSNPIELLKGSQVGEREPRANIFVTLLGIIFLGIGYYISLEVEDPIAATLLFFIAVIFVIAGTYCLFTSVSIAVLKILRKNKRYYYHPRHFTFISGMLYRMRQNAVGLANICILSTMVLVMLSTTVLLYVGIGDQIKAQFPRSVTITIHGTEWKDRDMVKANIEESLDKIGLSPVDPLPFYKTILPVTLEDDTYQWLTDGYSYSSNSTCFYFITADEYNDIYEQDILLDSESDVVVYDPLNNLKYPNQTLTVGSHQFHVQDALDDLSLTVSEMNGLMKEYYVIVKNYDVIQSLINEAPSEAALLVAGYYEFYFNLDMDKQEQLSYQETLTKALNDCGYITNIRFENDTAQNFHLLYGGLLFIGLFLGFLFIMATVLIIYYKQITEGYEDKERFAIMRNVGMSDAEVKKSIKSQVLSVFYMPLVVACIHTAFAFPIVSKLMAMLSMGNTRLFIVSLICTALIFAVFYTMIYMMTARVYYKIISAK